MSDWEVIYEKAVRDDGSLFFPERLTHEFLENAKKTMGSYLFANQYQNEIIPLEEQKFKPQWNRYFNVVPEITYSFAFVDPALSESVTADFTAVVVVQVDTNHDWYVRVAQRYKVNPSQIVNLLFSVQEQWKCMAIGIEDVAYQKALLYMVHDEMRRRNKIIPVTGVKPDNDKSKEARILGLVPRFEWGRIYLAKGLYDLEVELAQFPRGSHDDLIDALAYIDQIAHYPREERKKSGPPAPNSPDYEKWYISQLHKGRRPGSDSY